MRIPGWAWLVYALLGVSLEGVALANGWHNGDTLTENILAVFPGWAIYAGIGWLLFHFRRAR